MSTHQWRSRRKKNYRIEDGHKVIPMTENMAKAIDEQMAAFRQKFGRDPEPHEPLLFDPDADTPQVLSPEKQDELWDNVCQAARAAGVNPAIIYAMRKTRRMVTEQNALNLTDEELDEWEDAIDEYNDAATKGEPI